MSFRYEDRESSSHGLFTLALGAVAGLAVGVVVAQRFGGLAGISARLRERLGRTAVGIDEEYDIEDYDSDELDEADEDDDDAVLEERVLEAFRNDPILSERAVDIGAIGEGVIELAGWVRDDVEVAHAITIARGVPGVETVVNRMAVGEIESAFDDNVRRYESGDPALVEGHWEGQQVGTGRRRQGTSDEFDRHADPKPKLEERWLSADEAIRAAASESDQEMGTGARKAARKSARGGRADGSAAGPTGVPKADHVADPESNPDNSR
jgi:BON domain-containing protein